MISSAIEKISLPTLQSIQTFEIRKKNVENQFVPSTLFALNQKLFFTKNLWKFQNNYLLFYIKYQTQISS